MIFGDILSTGVKVIVCTPCAVRLYEIVVFVVLSWDAQTDRVGYP
jgi:hypothetical protein